MHAIWVAIDPRSTGTRILATAGPRSTLLHARLPRDVTHARALPTLLEALALWTGTPVRAAICADDRDAMSGMRLGLDSLVGIDGPPLDTIDVVERDRRVSRPDHPSELSDFDDLRAFLVEEVAR